MKVRLLMSGHPSAVMILIKREYSDIIGHRAQAKKVIGDGRDAFAASAKIPRSVTASIRKRRKSCERQPMSS